MFEQDSQVENLYYNQKGMNDRNLFTLNNKIQKEIDFDFIKPNENSFFMTKEETEKLFIGSNGPPIELHLPETPYETEYKPLELPDTSILKTNGTNSSTRCKKSDWTIDMPKITFQEPENSEDEF